MPGKYKIYKLDKEDQAIVRMLVAKASAKTGKMDPSTLAEHERKILEKLLAKTEETPMKKTFLSLQKSFDPYTDYSEIEKYNHNHDPFTGRFTSSAGAVAGNTVLGGGATADLKSGTSPTKGFMGVVDKDRSRVVNVPKRGGKEFKRNAVQAALNKYIKDNADLLFDKSKNKFLGTWIDSETGKLWLDVSTNFATREEAEKICKPLGELAIWDVENGEEIRF